MESKLTRKSKDDLVDGWCWRFASPEDKVYHDTEWGIPVHDDTRMFEHLCLECLQCGLSWNYVLQRRELFRQVFHGFDIDAVAAMGDKQIQQAIEVPGMLRSPRKLAAIVNNAHCVQQLQEEFGSFSAYFWQWTHGETIFYKGHEKGGIPAQNGLSKRIATDLKKRGFKYVGPVNIYAHLQACGIICDHNKNCPRYAYVQQNYPFRYAKRQGEK